ncbi:MAG TPA: PVC-type heme-binding CxxCH protein [Isosphaeraceae bacterium]|jgi:putative heme-binding domain-containing protein|nr:PVC-type heme-binding CxxCH protein [Isosphaeraceae bacterium]
MNRPRLLAPPRLSSLALMVVLAVASTATAADEGLELQPGDHISIIGNTLPDRMQHDGWLETLIVRRFPGHDLVLRDLGFSGDELTTRLRSAGFGSPDAWLTKTKADVVFAFFGYNESFAGEAGLPAFKKDLESFLKHTLAQKYNGKTPPRLVLFSPIAHENLRDRNLPDGAENNRRIALYTAAMAEVAKANDVRFVDLFHPSQTLYAEAGKPLTINGIHLTEQGNERLAGVIARALFPDKGTPEKETLPTEKVRQAILDKNFTWFNRYRTVDGYSIFGGRADLRFVDGQTNRDVMSREMEVLEAMTANRDKVVWAAARGREAKPDDSDTPPFIPVKTNKPGPLPGGAHAFVDGDEAIKLMRVHKGMKVNLFASEAMFPEVVNPVQMAFDTKGRLWVAVWPTYPHWKPKEEMNDKLLILEDTDGDGRADKRTVFADHLHCPTGFEFCLGGVLIAQAPDVWLLKDTDGDDKADTKVRILSGIDSADTHHTANSFAIDPGGAIYFQEGTFHHTQVESPYGPPRRVANAGVYRFEPRTQRFDVYVTFPFANPHGHAFDRWGQDIITDGTGSNPYHAALFSGYLPFPQKHARPPQVYQQRTRPCPGIEYLSSRHFPDDLQGNLLVGNVIGDQGILQYKIEDKGASFAGTELEPIVMSSDPSFRPTDMEFAPDGSLYFMDWQNPIIGHMQHNLRDPSRDRTHGRVYRVTCEGRPLLKPVAIAGRPIAELLDVLKEPEDRVRHRARIELGNRPTDEVVAAVGKWVEGLDRQDPQHEHLMLEALWVHQHHNSVNVELLKRVLTSPDFRARAAATRVLCYWRDRVPEALDLLKTLAADPHPRVRLEAVRAASYFDVPEAVEVPLISAEHPPDPYVDFVRGETMKALEPLWRKAIADGKQLALTSGAGAQYLLKNINTDELLKMKRDRAVDLELLFRKGVRDEDRRAGLADLARREGKGELPVLIDAIRKQDERPEGQDESVVFDLARLLTSRPAAELSRSRDAIEAMANSSRRAVTRQLGFVALIAADPGVDRAWKLGVKSVGSLHDLLEAMPLIRDPEARAALYPKVAPLLDALPKGLEANGDGKAVRGRFVRIELPGRRRTLTLAEVEVQSAGRNVARNGRASQKNTAYDGEAGRAIDGDTDPSYGHGSQTHSEENTANPWWEVDLGRVVPVESVVVYNRADGLEKRLDGFTLKVLDDRRRVVFERSKLPAPERKLALDLGRDPEGTIRRAAMIALTSVRGREPETVKALARFVRADADRAAAIQALQRIPTNSWPQEEAAPLLDGLLGYVRGLPTAERTSPEALAALELGDRLTTLLPPDRARAARKELGSLGVRMIRIGTVTDQMLFDKDRLVVQAGKPVEVLFENSDLMPHNFVVTKPGSLEEVGLLAESTATQPGALERNYVPRTDKVLFATRLLQPRDSQKLDFTAPSQAGVYPYVCTYPGHWRRMYGALYVVADLDDYLADPQGYLAKHPTPIADELLKSNRPRTEWKFDDLASAATKLEGRSFSNGKQMFRVANCVACHRLGGEGQQIGPDLAKLDPKTTTTDILRSVLEPSAKIDDKYRTWVFQTQDGRVVTGMILEETPEAVKVIENPLAKAEPVVLKPADIAERARSASSIMPKGQLDKLTRAEVLDLLAFVASGGDPHGQAFRDGHDHGGH